MIRKIGRRSWAFIALIGIAAARFLFQQLGENILGSVYTEYIEPSITRKIYVITKSREELENDGIFNIVEEYVFPVDVILLFVIVSIIILCIALLARKIYLQKNIKRNAQEECILQAMKALVYDTEYILAAQLYRYRIDTVRRGRNRNKKIVIDHIGSNYNDGMDINAIVHEEFMLEGKHYKNVTLFLSRYNEFDKTNLNGDYQKAADGISHTIEIFKREFASLTPDKIEEKHCVHYALYKGIQCTLGKEEWNDPIPGCNDDVCFALRNSKRTGCLPAILLQSVYTFRNGQSPFKQDRLYWSIVGNEDLLPTGYKKTLIVLTLSYDQIQQRNERFIKTDLVRLVNGYLKAASGGKQNGATSGQS